MPARRSVSASTSPNSNDTTLKYETRVYQLRDRLHSSVSEATSIPPLPGIYSTRSPYFQTKPARVIPKARVVRVKHILSNQSTAPRRSLIMDLSPSPMPVKWTSDEFPDTSQATWPHRVVQVRNLL